MISLRCATLFAVVIALRAAFSFAAPVPADPLAAIDLNRSAIIADIVQGFDGDRPALAKRLARLRADQLLSASLASTRESLETILGEAEKARDAGMTRASAKRGRLSLHRDLPGGRVYIEATEAVSGRHSDVGSGSGEVLTNLLHLLLISEHFRTAKGL